MEDSKQSLAKKKRDAEIGVLAEVTYEPTSVGNFSGAFCILNG